MKVIITSDGEKRYRFEDRELETQRRFERDIAGLEEIDFAKFFADILGEIRLRRGEAFRNAIEAIKQIDPDFDGEVSYEYFQREFRKLERKPK